MRILEMRIIEKNKRPWESVTLELGLDELQCKLLEVNLLTQLQHIKHRKILKDKPWEDIRVSWQGGDSGYQDIVTHMNRKQAQEIITELTSVKKYPYQLKLCGERI